MRHRTLSIGCECVNATPRGVFMHVHALCAHARKEHMAHACFLTARVLEAIPRRACASVCTFANPSERRISVSRHALCAHARKEHIANAGFLTARVLAHLSERRISVSRPLPSHVPLDTRDCQWSVSHQRTTNSRDAHHLLPPMICHELLLPLPHFGSAEIYKINRV